MKRLLLSAALLGATVAPALAGDGTIDNTGALLIQAAGRLLGKLAGMF